MEYMMLIKKLTIENFWLFPGKHKIEFSIDPKQNVNIIVGKNASGKTILFNAMKWCLFGSKSKQSEFAIERIKDDVFYD
jgi:DNA sulfur modification protein DndD